MTVHIIKLCVGVEEVSELADWQAKRIQQAKAIGEEFVLKHVTRNTPKRKDEIIKGGSLYWVIRRFVQVRQRIIDIKPVEREDGKPACALILDPELVRTALYPHRPFQGWRYLETADAPHDINHGSNTDEQALPTEMIAELRELGLI